MRLFGENGYDATSVADIQVAAGLAAGSGALYKHFASKRDLLADGVHRYVADLEKSRAGLAELLPEEPRAALTLIAEAVPAAMAGDRAMIRVGLRDLEQFPDLLEVLWDGLLGALYRELAGWLRAQQARGAAGTAGTAGAVIAAGPVDAVAVPDPDATAAVLVASLTYFRVLEALTGHTPGDVALSAYTRAWVDSAVATVTASSA